jgi:hypothetical protein
LTDNAGSFQRWQAITIGQLTYAIDLILGFAVAALGFVVTLLLDGKFDKTISQPGLSLVTAALAVLLLAVSAGFGIFLVVNRLIDFRTTARIARERQSGTGQLGIADRNRAKKLGARTWLLFWIQLGSFGVGVILLLVAGILISYLRVFSPKPLSSYAGISLGMTMTQVEYALGYADYVSNPFDRPVSDAGELRFDTTKLREWEVRKYLLWEYGKPFGDGPEIEVEFDPRSLKVIKVSCDMPSKAGHCPPLLGIEDGMMMEQLAAKMGPPTSRSGSSIASTLTYRDHGIFVLVLLNKVVSYGIDIEAE